MGCRINGLLYIIKGKRGESSVFSNTVARCDSIAPCLRLHNTTFDVLCREGLGIIMTSIGTPYLEYVHVDHTRLLNVLHTGGVCSARSD